MTPEQPTISPLEVTRDRNITGVRQLMREDPRWRAMDTTYQTHIATGVATALLAKTPKGLAAYIDMELDTQRRDRPGHAVDIMSSERYEHPSTGPFGRNAAEKRTHAIREGQLTRRALEKTRDDLITTDFDPSALSYYQITAAINIAQLRYAVSANVTRATELASAFRGRFDAETSTLAEDTQFVLMEVRRKRAEAQARSAEAAAQATTASSAVPTEVFLAQPERLDPLSAAGREEVAGVTFDADAMLDEIDEILEENAEEMRRNVTPPPGEQHNPS